MLSSLNSVISRRLLLGWLLVCPLLVRTAAAAVAVDPLAGLRPWGRGEYRRFGFLIYEAALWAAGDDPLSPPMALKLTYRRHIYGKDIVEASRQEMRVLGADVAAIKHWSEQMTRIFPDVRAGDSIVGLHLPEGARFFHNDRLLGSIDDAAFARAFFAIWLDPKTSATELRAALLKRPAA